MQIKKFGKKLLEKAGITSGRTKNITKHVLLSMIYKGGHILANFLLVPLTIDFLDTENYGVWLTLSSFIGWFTFFDVGLGNGLRNKFAEAKSLGKLDLAKGYVSTAYFTLGSICIALFLISISFSFIIDWSEIFNTSDKLKEQLQILMPIVFGCFSLQLLSGLITPIFLADQNHSISGKISFINSVSTLVIIYILTQTLNSSLLYFGLIISLIPVLILVYLNVYAFTGPYKIYSPSFNFVRKEYLNNIFGQGISFFIIQISTIVLVSTDNIIISQILGPEQVVPYNIAYKYMGISSMVLGIIVTPYWSSFTEAFTINDMDWIKKSMKSLRKITVLAVAMTVLLVVVSGFAYNLWIGDKVIIPISLTFFMGIYFIVNIINAPNVIFINGVGKIRLQMYILIFGALVNIPLSIVLLKYTSLGVEAVIIATTICVLPCIFFYPIQYKKLVDGKARNLWNR